VREDHRVQPPQILPQTFTLVAYDEMDNVIAKLRNGALSDFEITTADIEVQATGNGGYLAAISVQLKDELPLGRYSDVLILNGTNRGKEFFVEVPLSFVYKLEQESLSLDEVEDKVFGDANFVLTATGGSGSGAVTFAKISGNANINKNTGEVEITGAGDIVVIATKAEDATYQQAQSQELTVRVAKAEPPYTVPTDLTATYGDLLSSVELPENWAWEDETALVGDVGTQIHKAKFTPEDTENYLIVNDIDVEVAVSDIISSSELPQTNPLRAWMRSGLLHITGITSGEMLSIYNTAGTLLYRTVTTSNEMNIPLREKGVYLVRVGYHSVKVVNYDL
jgi:hypothetical protein